MAYPANLAVTNWGSLQSGNTADLDTNFRNLQVGLNGIGNGSSSLSSVSISVASIGQANVGGINANSAVIQTATITSPIFQTPLSIGNGGTNQATFANSSVVVITAGSMVGILPAANGTVLTSNGTAWGPAVLPTSLAVNPITNSINSNITFNTAYTDGPSVNVGNVGTWYVSGSLTYQLAVAGTASFILWDGLNLIQSGTSVPNGANIQMQNSLSGIITNPQGNLRLSILVNTSTGTMLQKNLPGSNLASYIVAYRIS